MRKKADATQNRGELVGNAMRRAATNAAVPFEEVMTGADHAFSIYLDPMLALDGELLIRRESVADRVRRVVSDPILDIHVIHPATQWSQYFRDAVRRMDPPGGPTPSAAALDVHIYTFADNIEKLLGTPQFAAQVDTQPEGYYANIWDDFVLISYTHATRLSLTVTD
ncbi:hypothetical protein [Nocardia sp. NPDC127526]|uniref:hypothetical protein n=1 Tax=Nocardia sp. NPDC127526 TaxID=3345393 RepID=UPI00362DA3AF